MPRADLRLVDTVSGEVIDRDARDSEIDELRAYVQELESDRDPQAVRTIHLLQAQLRDAERDLRVKRGMITKLHADRERERQNHPARAVIVRLFDYWREQTGHRNSKLTGDRFDACLKCLELGYTEEQCRRAIEGAAFDPFEKPRKNGTVERFDDFELIFRSGRYLERFANRAPRRPEAPAPQTSLL